MKISEISIKQPVFSTMVVAAMVVFGLVAYNRIGVDLKHRHCRPGRAG